MNPDSRVLGIARPWWIVACVGYGVLLAYLVLAVPTLPTAAVGWVTSGLGRVGVTVSDEWSASALNVALFVPLGFLGTALLPRLRPADWTLLAFVGSCVIEVVQRLALPDRSAEARDVVANTLGALLGALLFRLVARGRPGEPREGGA